jgi:hypothetical protein
LNPINKSNPPIASAKAPIHAKKMQEQQQRFRHMQHLWEPKATSNNPKLLSIGDQGI